MPTTKETKAERYRNGKCERCNVRAYKPGRKKCVDCLERDNVRTRKSYAKRMKAELLPICRRCTFDYPVVNSKSRLCKECAGIKEEFASMHAGVQAARVNKRLRLSATPQERKTGGWTSLPMETRFLNDYQDLIYFTLDHYQEEDHLGYNMQTLLRLFPESIDDWTKTEAPNVVSRERVREGATDSPRSFG